MPESPEMLWPRVLSALASGESLSSDDAAAAMRTVMEGNATPGQIGGFLMALRTKGETVDELDGFASAALEFARPVRSDEPLLDTCGVVQDRSVVKIPAPAPDGMIAAVQTSNGDSHKLKSSTSRLFLPSRKRTLTAFAELVVLTTDSSDVYAFPPASARVV
jgi:anthranilate phosphoribosyltransferase